MDKEPETEKKKNMPKYTLFSKLLAIFASVVNL